MTVPSLKDILDPKLLTVAGTTVALLLSIWILGSLLNNELRDISIRVDAHNTKMGENENRSIEVLTEIRDGINLQNQLLLKQR
jgi:hypothetical protein